MSSVQLINSLGLTIAPTVEKSRTGLIRINAASLLMARLIRLSFISNDKEVFERPRGVHDEALYNSVFTLP